MASDSEDSTSDEVEEMNEANYDLKQTLFARIEEIKATGSFATGNVLTSVPIPGIRMDDDEPITIPLSENAAKDLAKKSDKAPFGNGRQTIVDETVRDTLQIGAARISFKNTQWDAFVNTLVQRVAGELGVPPAPDGPTVYAELYKNLLYPPGAMFKPHKGTEKDPCMFATLVICLPSEHTGGTVCLQHGDDSVELSTAGTSAFNYYYLAWYTDVTHEIKPVETGYRWVLTYNLIMDSRNSCLSASALDSQTEKLVGALSSWEGLEYPPDFLLYPLNHQYTPRNLRLSSLKGVDCQRARCLKDSCDKKGEFYLLLAVLNKYESWDNYDGSDHKYGTYLDKVRSLEGFVLSDEKVNVDESTLLVRINYHGRNPDHRTGGEFTGNEHMEMEEKYEDTVLVIVPAGSIDIPFFNRENSPIIANRVLTHLLSNINENTRATLQTILLRICRVILDEGIAAKEANDVYLGYVAVTSASLRDWPLFKEAQKNTRRGWDIDSWSALGGLIDLQDGSVDANDIYECMLKCDNFPLVYQILSGFYNEFCSSDIGRKDPAKAKYWKQWYSDRLIETLDRCESCTGTDDAVTIKEILDLDVKYTSEQQNKVDDAVMDLVDHLKDDKTFVNALTVQLLLGLSKPDSVRTDILRRVFNIILDAAISTFDLEFYYAYAYRSFYCSYTDTLIRDFYKEALTHSKDSAFDLLLQLSSQTFKAKQNTVSNILLPVMKELLPSVDTGSPEVQTCFQSLVEAYITQTVGKEPPKPEPEDWARPMEVHDCGSMCKTCPELNAFVKDPKAKEKTIALSDDDQRHLKHYFRYLKIEKGNRGGEIRFTKTLMGWERHLEDWTFRGKRAQEQLRGMPKELKEALGDKYDTLMGLDLLRIDRTTDERGGISQASDKTQPSTRPKRLRGKDAQDTEPERDLKRTRRAGAKDEG